MSDGGWVTLARLVRPQGRKGEILADLLTDFPKRFDEQPAVSLQLPDGSRRDGAVESWWLPTGRSAGRIVLKLRGTDSINDAEQLLQAKVQIKQNERLELQSGNYYVSDLVGCRVVHQDAVIGVVVDMHFPQDPAGRRIEDAAAIFVVERENGDEVLIPFATAFVLRMDVAAKVLEMNLPDGLLQMNG